MLIFMLLNDSSITKEEIPKKIITEILPGIT
jgi:hypothetical protein